MQKISCKFGIEMMETKKINGIVKTIRKDKTAVCIEFNNEEEGNALESEWFSLGEKVKPEYISVGSSCEASVIENGEGGGNRIVVFIKCEKSQQPQQSKQADIKPFKKGNEIIEDRSKSMYVSYTKDIFLELSRKSPPEIQNAKLTEEAIDILKQIMQAF